MPPAIPRQLQPKMLDEKGIQPGQVKGTGVGGRITKEDAVKAQAPVTSKATESKTPVPAAPAVARRPPGEK